MIYKYACPKIFLAFRFYFCGMKRILPFILLTLVLAACGGQNDLSDPNVVAQNFLNAFVTMDYTTAQKYATKEFREELEQFEFENSKLSKEDAAEHKKSTAEIKGVEIMDAEGLAIFKYSNSHFPDIVNQIELTKIEDSWYVNKNENPIDKELDKQFPDEEMQDYMEEEAEMQEEILPTENEG